ncbi:unnamed protein product [Blepharisma stoltei]|uniref:Uncharacterized protein n=1 Tax=Blepharisma stoltei TaxID=1481888 RepID=A0AAU9K9H8_9CILI|nr:unnamed protein product [Blepharisma stoltei]
MLKGLLNFIYVQYIILIWEASQQLALIADLHRLGEFLKSKEKEIEEKNREIEELYQHIKEKDQIIQELYQNINQKNESIEYL